MECADHKIEGHVGGTIKHHANNFVIQLKILVTRNLSHVKMRDEAKKKHERNR